MKCPRCGADANEYDAFCGECGLPFVAEGRPTGGDSPAISAPPPPPLSGESEPPSPVRLPSDLNLTPQAMATVLPERRPKNPARILRVLGLAGVVILAVLFQAWNRGAFDALKRKPASGEVIFQDDFANSSGWYTDGDASTKIAYMGGEYAMTILTANYMATRGAKRDLSLDDVDIEVDARAVDGSVDNALGIVYRWSAQEEFYWFAISSDGLWTVNRSVVDDWVSLADWKESSAIKQGLGATNRLKVSCRGDVFTFYVNGILLGTVTDANLKKGDVGLAVGASDLPGVEVHFDNLKVSAPLEED